MAVGIGNTPFGADHILTDAEYDRFNRMDGGEQQTYLMRKGAMMQQAISARQFTERDARLNEYRLMLERGQAIVEGNLRDHHDEWHTQDGYAWVVKERVE